MLTIFACPKPFTDPHIAIIQRNAITSWTLLKPRPEIILFADEPGTAEICQELGLRHVPDVARNEYGTPLLNHIFEKAQQMAAHDLLCFINADVILMNDFIRAVQQVASWEKPFLLAGEKRDIELRYPLNFNEPDWQAKLRSLALEFCRRNEAHYRTKAKCGAEFFVFRRGLFAKMPPLLVGRWAWDGWLLWRARRLGALVVDATPVVLAVHQNHDHSHIYTEGDRPWLAPEAIRNLKLARIKRYWFLREATHVMTPSGPRRVWGEKFRFWCSTAAQDLVIYRLAPLRRVLGLRRNTLRRIKAIIRSIA